MQTINSRLIPQLEIHPDQTTQLFRKEPNTLVLVGKTVPDEETFKNLSGFILNDPSLNVLALHYIERKIAICVRGVLADNRNNINKLELSNIEHNSIIHIIYGLLNPTAKVTTILLDNLTHQVLDKLANSLTGPYSHITTLEVMNLDIEATYKLAEILRAPEGKISTLIISSMNFQCIRIILPTLNLTESKIRKLELNIKNLNQDHIKEIVSSLSVFLQKTTELTLNGNRFSQTNLSQDNIVNSFSLTSSTIPSPPNDQPILANIICTENHSSNRMTRTTHSIFAEEYVSRTEFKELKNRVINQEKHIELVSKVLMDKNAEIQALHNILNTLIMRSSRQEVAYPVYNPQNNSNTFNQAPVYPLNPQIQLQQLHQLYQQLQRDQQTQQLQLLQQLQAPQQQQAVQTYQIQQEQQQEKHEQPPSHIAQPPLQPTSGFNIFKKRKLGNTNIDSSDVIAPTNNEDNENKINLVKPTPKKI